VSFPRPSGSINNRGNLYHVDGRNITDQISSRRLGGIGTSVDEIQEFRVLTNNYNAEYGQVGGFIINALSKSGENGIRGDGHKHFRGTYLAASNYFYNLRLGTSRDGAPCAPLHCKEGALRLVGRLSRKRQFVYSQSVPETVESYTQELANIARGKKASRGR
jgi:hypothetical protein